MHEYMQLFIFLMIYLIPTVIAVFRGHRDHNAISVMNFFLGWTGFFWVWSLIWAFTGNVKERKINA